MAADSIKTASKKKVVIFGHSFAEQHSGFARTPTVTWTPTGIVCSAGTVSAFVGDQVLLWGCNEEQLNGWHTVTAAAGNNSATLDYSGSDSGTATGKANGIRLIGSAQISMKGWFNTFNAVLGSPFEVTGIVGMGGATSAYLLADFKHALSLNPDMVIIMAAENSIFTGVSAASVFSDVRGMIDTCLAAHITPMVCECMMPDTGYGAASTAEKYVVLQFNKMLNNYARDNAGILVVPYMPTVTSPTSTTFAANAGLLLSGDGLHPTSQGGAKIGTDMAVRFSGFFKPSFLNVSAGDAYAVDPASKQLCPNPLMQGIAGTEAGGATGDTATSWTLTLSTGATATAAGTVVARADGFGNDQVITIGGTANSGDYVKFHCTLPVEAITAGGKIKVGFSLDVSGLANVKDVNGYQQVQYTGNGSYIGLNNGSTALVSAPVVVDGYFESSVITLANVPNGSTFEFWIWMGAGVVTGVVKIGRVTVMQIE